MATVEGVMHGLYLLWWVQERHVPVAALATILAAGDLAVAALEFPTGWLADRHGHRTSLIVGSVLQIAGMLFAWLGRGIPGVLTSCLLIAAGDAFRSGADQALLYRSCAALGRESAFQRIEGRTGSGQLAALVALLVAGGAIVQTWGFAVAWLTEITLCAIGLILACAMFEPPATIDAITPATILPLRAGSAAPRRWRPAGGLSSIVALIGPASLLGAVAGAGAFLAQTGGESTPAGITALVALVTLSEAAGSATGTLFAAGMRIQLMLAAAGIAITAAMFSIPNAFVPGVVALCFLMGLAYPLRAASIQRVAADRVRARAASLASACDKALAIVALVAAGWLPIRRH